LQESALLAVTSLHRLSQITREFRSSVRLRLVVEYGVKDDRTGLRFPTREVAFRFSVSLKSALGTVEPLTQ
jgi:hypothetical protein